MSRSIKDKSLRTERRRTTKLVAHKATIGNRGYTTVLDIGSTYNYVSNSILKENGIIDRKTSKMFAEHINREKIYSAAKCDLLISLETTLGTSIW